MMEELIRTNDPVTLSFVEALLKSLSIPYYILDQNMSVLEGSIGILPRRVMVEAASLQQARNAMIDAGIEAELAPPRK